MSELSDYRRIVEKPAIDAYEAKLSGQRAIVEALTAERDVYKAALEKIQAGRFNCSPHQYGMAMQGVAEEALSPKDMGS